MKQLGFDGYAIQFVAAPQGMMWYLQKDLNMHRTVSLILSEMFNQVNVDGDAR